ncbi:hypothetical protein [Planctomycetes bacterium K23_9]|uniref:Uncharacterized protein n=1 Tax=Stieleria marina TaxID=1930275 RepID=A0A517NSD9_9BACT|nr:hypothetical protein K239x_19590 [Planctomycetes bacterium K23_9]
MNEKTIPERVEDSATASTRLSNYFSQSVVGCHVMSACVAACLAIATAWVWQNSYWFAGDKLHSQEQIHDAIELISQSAEIRQQHAAAKLETAARSDDAAEIRHWLPLSVDWDKQKRFLVQLAQQTDVELVDVEKKQVHVGMRVGTVTSTCQINGTFDQICQFLSQLPRASTPIWCDGVKLKRSREKANQPNRCQATLSLRSPFTGQKTIAEKIISLELPNAT